MFFCLEEKPSAAKALRPILYQWVDIFLHIQIKEPKVRPSLPRPQVPRTRRPVVDGQDIKVLLQREAFKHQLYPVVLRCHNHPRAVGIVRIAVRVAGALYRPVGTV